MLQNLSSAAVVIGALRVNSLPHAFLSSADFIKINFFEKFFQEYNQSVKQCGSRLVPTFLSTLIWAQTVCKDN